MLYSPASIANGLLNEAFREGARISAMKLHKLVYFVHGFALAGIEEEAYRLNEEFEAWPFGPILPSLFHELRLRGGNPITKFLNGFNMRTLLPYATPDPVPTEPALQGIVEMVWQKFAPLSERHLSLITNGPNMPWSKIMHDGQGPMRFYRIDDASIMKAFQDIIVEREEDEGGADA